MTSIILVSALIGWTGVQLSPEAQRFIAISDMRGCQFISEVYIQKLIVKLTRRHRPDHRGIFRHSD